MNADQPGTFLRRGRRLLVPLAILAAVPVLTTVVEAAVPDSAGGVHACYSTNTGEARIIDSAVGICADYERKVILASGLALEIVQEAASLNAGTTAGATATCPVGKKVVGGGVFVLDAAGNLIGTAEVFVLSSGPVTPQRWAGSMQNKGAQNYALVVRAICANA